MVTLWCQKHYILCPQSKKTTNPPLQEVNLLKLCHFCGRVTFEIYFLIKTHSLMLLDKLLLYVALIILLLLCEGDSRLAL